MKNNFDLEIGDLIVARPTDHNVIFDGGYEIFLKTKEGFLIYEKLIDKSLKINNFYRSVGTDDAPNHIKDNHYWSYKVY
jgi:hypothetical protein